MICNLLFASESFKHLEKILQDCMRICNANNIKVCLAFGTLLGWKREGRIIPYDHDTDLFIHAKDIDRVIESFPKGSVHALNTKGVLALLRYKPGKFHGHTDLYILYPLDGKKGWCTMQLPDQRCYDFRMEPFKQTTFYGIDTHVPDDPHSLLTLWYGDYMKPKKHNYLADYDKTCVLNIRGGCDKQLTRIMLKYPWFKIV